MKIYFDDGTGCIRPGDDRELKPVDVTFRPDGSYIIGSFGYVDARRRDITIYRRTSLKGQTRGLAELRIYESIRVEVARQNPIAEEP